MKNNTKGKIANIIEGESTTKYKIGLIIIVAIISIILLVMVYGNKVQDGEQIGMDEAIDTKISEAGDMAGTISEQASTQMGKTVNEAKKENNPIIIEDEKNEQDNSKKVQEIKEEKTENKQTISKTQSKEDAKKQSEEKNDEKKQNDEKLDNESKTQKEPQFSMPAEGEIIKEYAKDKLVYSDTLKEWITHTGIDIKADKTSVVKASEEGKIKSIKNDPRYGLTVVIEHSNGYSTVYSNLLTAEFIKVGEQVKKGQTIATVGNTATFEMADESHVHFEILKDNVQIDPNMYIK